MDKEKIEKAVKRICYLSKFKSCLSGMGMIENQEYFYREIVKSAREIVTAAGDDIAEKHTPAGQYVSDIIFIADGSAIVYYNGNTASKRLDISAKYALYPTD